MKRTLLALGLAGAMVIPAGAAIAQSGFDDAPNGPATTTMLQNGDQARDQVRVQDAATCDGDCDGVGVAGVIPAQKREQERDQVRVQDPATCDGDGPFGDGPNGPNSNGPNGPGGPNGSGDGSGDGFGAGPHDGSGPIHDGPGDGSGNQFGRAGR